MLLTCFLSIFITNYKFFSGIKLIFFGVAIILFYAGVFALKSQTKDLNLSEAQIVKIDNIINVLTLNLDKVDNSGRGDLVENILIDYGSNVENDLHETNRLHHRKVSVVPLAPNP